MASTTQSTSQSASNQYLSLFHEWRSVDHSFDEMRILIKEAKLKHTLSPQLEHQLDQILEDGIVSGGELLNSRGVHLKDQYVAIYFDGSSIKPVDLLVPVKDSNVVSSQPFLLPLLFQSKQTQTWVLQMTDDSFQLMKMSGNDLTQQEGLSFENFRDYLIKNKLITPLDDDTQSTDYLKVGFSKASLDDKRKKLSHKIFDDARKLIAPNNEPLVILCSNHYYSYFNEDSIKHPLENMVAIKYNPQKSKGINRTEILNLIQKIEIPSCSSSYNYSLETNDPVYVKSLIDENKVDQVEINAALLEFHLGSMEQKEDLVIVDQFMQSISSQVKEVSAGPTSDFFRISSNKVLETRSPSRQQLDTREYEAIRRLVSSYLKELS